MPLIDMEIFLFFDVFGIFVGFEFPRSLYRDQRLR